jgi:proline dehydrogenase
MLNKVILSSLNIVPKPIVRLFANSYIAGETISDAVKTVKKLNSLNCRASIDLLGEYVKNKDQALKEMDLRYGVIDAIIEDNLNSNQSIKLTSLGLEIDFEFCYENTLKIVKYAKERNVNIRMDMEDSPFHDRTFDIYNKLRNEGYDNVGVVIQACMKRSNEDLEELFKQKASVRLCKGIYVEPENIAYKTYDEINNNYKKLLDYLFDKKMFVGIATHDDFLINYAFNQISERNLSKDEYEFQMLLGVRESKRDEIIKLGHNMRIYVSFGKDWYGYSMRRFKENPQIVGHVFKSILTGGK